MTSNQGVVKKYALSPTRQAIGKSLGRNAKEAFAKHSLESKTMRKPFFTRIHRMVAAEMKKILMDTTCKVKVEGANSDALKASTWEDQYTTLSRIAPVLIGILDACVPNQSSKRQCTIVSCVAILVKSHHRLSIFHLLSSLILHFGHAGKLVCMILYLNITLIPFYFLKQVYTRLEKTGLCLSRMGTWTLIDMLGRRHDEEVMKWVTALQVLTPTSHVSCLAVHVYEPAFHNFE